MTLTPLSQQGFLVEKDREIHLFDEGSFNWNVPSFYENTQTIGSIWISMKPHDKRIQFAYLQRENIQKVDKASDLLALEKIMHYPIQ